MKAVIVETKDNFAAALQDDGTVVRVTNKNYRIGQKIDIKDGIFHRRYKLIALAVSAAMLFMMLGGGVWSYASPYYYVSLDVNPSIEYSVNRFERVIDVKAVNDDGTEILTEIGIGNIKNKSIEQAIQQTVEQLTQKDYIGEEGGVVIASSGENIYKTKELVQTLQMIIKAVNKQNNNDIEVMAYVIGSEDVQKARELGVTPGKLRLAELLKENSAYPDNIKLEEWVNKSVKEIMKAFVEDNSKENTEDTANIIDDESEESIPNKPLKEEEVQDNTPNKAKNVSDIQRVPLKSETPQIPEVPEIQIPARKQETPEIPVRQGRP